MSMLLMGARRGGSASAWDVDLPTGYTIAGRGQPAVAGGTAWVPATFSLADYPGTVYTPADSTALQTAIDAAVAGDRIVLTAGTNYDTANGFTLPAKASTGSILICSSTINAGTFPKAPGERVSPSDLASMPQIRVTSGGSSACFTTRIASAYNALQRGWRFEGLCLRQHPTSVNANSMLLALGSDNTQSSITVNCQPEDFIASRCYMTGNNTLLTTHVYWSGGRRCAVIDSYLENATEGSEAKAILCTMGSGPFHIENNFLESRGINILWGGITVPSVDMLPSDIVVKRNHFFKRLAWEGTGSKNLYEHKTGNRVLVEGNIFENSFNDGQIHAILVYSTNQDNIPAASAWQRTTNFTMRYNVVKNTSHGFNLFNAEGDVGYNSPGRSERFVIEHNVVEFKDRWAAQFGGALYGMYWRWNTQVFMAGGVYGDLSTGGGGKGVAWQDANSFYVSGEYRDSITGRWVVSGGSGGATTQTTITSRASDATVTRNMFWYGDTLDAGNLSSNTGTTMDAFFVNRAAGNYRIATAFAAENAGEGGFDMGADIDGLDALTVGAVSGVWS